jgi:predicted nucleic-acid-binding protein
MNTIVDTNILIRFLVGDSEHQQSAAIRILEKATTIVIPTHVFCELVWVLLSAYKFKSISVLDAVVKLSKMRKVQVKDDEIQAGLLMLEKGGDFADGVNAYCGRNMVDGASVFVSFDRAAVQLLTEQGISALIPT